MLEEAIVWSLEAIQALIFRGPRAPYPLTPSMSTTIRAWKVGLTSKRYPANAVSPNAPIWKNPFPTTLHVTRPDSVDKIQAQKRLADQGSLRPLTCLWRLECTPRALIQLETTFSRLQESMSTGLPKYGKIRARTGTQDQVCQETHISSLCTSCKGCLISTRQIKRKMVKRYITLG